MPTPSRLAILAAFAAVALSCATNPATGRRQVILMTEAQEIQLGREADAEIRREMGVYDDAELQRYVETIGQRLARASHRPNIPWTFAVVDESAINAFALPGGFLYVTRGILPFLRDESELAGVLGHEIGHVDAKHGVEQYSQQTLVGGAMMGAAILAPKTQPFLGVSSPFFQLLFLKHGRGAELESDALGVRYASLTGWAPRGMEGVLRTLGRLEDAQGSRRGVPNWALSHPPAEERVTRIQEHVAAATPTGQTTNLAEFERRIDRIVVGDSREKGLVRGSEFVHPILRFSVRFPDGWNIVNGSTQVSAAEGESSSAAMILELSKHASGSVAQAARADMAEANLVEVSGGGTRINGLEAYVGVYEGLIQNTRVSVRAAHIRSGQHIYLLAGLTRATDFARADRAFQPAIQSFRAMSQADADRIQPNRLAFHVVRQGDTWESLAQRAGPYGAPRPASLAIMNGSEPGTAPKVGARVRIVVGG